MRSEHNGQLNGGDLDAMRLEANARRQRLSGNVDELSWRMRPGNLVQEAKDRAWAEVDRVTDEALSVAEDMVTDATEWVRANPALALGGTATALLSAALVWYATRRKTVPLYAAYDMEDSPMTETDETLSARAAGAWGKVKDEARGAGDKATETYYAARSKAAMLSDEARVRASEAAEATREAADKARVAAGEAGDWAKRQPQENPAMVVVAALAAGALIGALLPSGRRTRA